jgi:hypothetical protein
MTSASSGGYVVQTSGNNATSNDGWKAFNSVGFNGQTNAGDHWITPDLYTHDSGAFEHASTAIYQPLGNGATGAGAWIAIKLPHKIKLTKLRVDNVSKAGFRDYTVHGRNGGGAIVGGTAWSSALLTVADEGSGYSIIGNYVFTETSHDITTNDYYEEFIIIITKKTPASSSLDNFLLMRELQFFGLPEYDPEAHGTDVVLHTTPNVPNTDWLEVYYDAKDLTNISGTVADLSGKSVTGTLNGDVSIDTLNDVKSFSFDGSGDYISGTLTNTGDFNFTVSTWVFETNGTTNNNVWCIGNPAGSAGPAVALGINNVGSLDFFVFGGTEIRFSQFRDRFGINKWHHIVCTRAGTTMKYFINGIDQARPIAFSTALSIAANSVFTIGARAGGQLGNNPMHGKIANFRLYNQALSADEIWELYAYQKEYFGVSPDVVTLKAGRLGIGTSEPRAVLDVRGDIRGGCPVFFQAAATGSTINATQLIPYNNVLNNKGGGYNPSTRLFTAPIAGFYHFSFYHMSNWSQTEGIFTLNGTYVEAGGTPIRVHSNVGGSHSPASASLNVYMNASDTMGIMLTSGNMFMSASQYAGFNGFYLSS